MGVPFAAAHRAQRAAQVGLFIASPPASFLAVRAFHCHPSRGHSAPRKLIFFVQCHYWYIGRAHQRPGVAFVEQAFEK